LLAMTSVQTTRVAWIAGKPRSYGHGAELLSTRMPVAAAERSEAASPNLNTRFARNNSRDCLNFFLLRGLPPERQSRRTRVPRSVMHNHPHRPQPKTHAASARELAKGPAKPRCHLR